MEQIHVIVITFECLNHEQISSYLSLFMIRTDARENYIPYLGQRGHKLYPIMDQRQVPVLVIEGSILPPPPSSLTWERTWYKSLGHQTALIPFLRCTRPRILKQRKKRHKNRKFAPVKHLANSLALEKILSCTRHSKNRHYIDSRIAIHQMLKSRFNLRTADFLSIVCRRWWKKKISWDHVQISSAEDHILLIIVIIDTDFCHSIVKLISMQLAGLNLSSFGQSSFYPQ